MTSNKPEDKIHRCAERGAQPGRDSEINSDRTGVTHIALVHTANWATRVRRDRSQTAWATNDCAALPERRPESMFQPRADRIVLVLEFLGELCVPFQFLASEASSTAPGAA